MNKHIRKLVFIFAMAMLAFGCAGHYSPMDTSGLTTYEKMVHSVVVLPGCTGIVLKNDGQNSIVLTAAHCVKRFQVNVKYLPIPMLTLLKEKKICIGDIVNVNEKRDLALIVAKKCPLMTTIAPLAKNEPKLGNTVYSVGHPLSANYVLTKGIVSRVKISDGEQNYMILSAPVINGNSGGPAFNSNGELIGVEIAILTGPVFLGETTLPLRVGITHLNLIVPLNDIKLFLKVSGFSNLFK